MEARKEAVRGLKACRFCLGRSDLTSIYDKSHQSSAVPLPLQIMSCVSIEVFPSDGMPSMICSRCAFFITQGYQFKHICRAADEQLLRFVQTGEPTTPVPWPKELLETEAAVVGGKYPDAVKDEYVKDEYEEDESEDDVFNIKIETEGSGEDRGMARIKVTQRDGQIHIEEDDDQQESESVGGSPKKDLSTGTYPCPQCTRVFPLRQLRELHVKQHHRKRSVQCPYCPNKFFSKYDLATHLDTHSEESPFECRACGHHFKRYTLMMKHEKAKHPDLRTYACKLCSDTFMSCHELLAHERRHKAYDERPFACPVTDPPCSSKFRNKNTLARHIDLVHSAGKFSCEYCSKKFTSSSRLARHVKEHAGQRPFPCNYCSKTFIKSHHHTRHLRVAHGHLSRQMHSGVGEYEIYQCSECTESFNSQESLAYHEAKHAAQNLTCPLCQERFVSVEAVTDHVKLHADQDSQFMCDFCELVFVSEARLDRHMLDEHAEEMDAREAEEDDVMVSGNQQADIREMPSLQAQEELQAMEATEPELAVEEVRTDTEETTYTELATVDTLSIARVQTSAPVTPVTPTPATPPQQEQSPVKTPVSAILRKAEEVKRRAQQERSQTELSPIKQRIKMAAGGAAIIRRTVSPEKRPNGESFADFPPKQKVVTQEKVKEHEKERETAKEEKPREVKSITQSINKKWEDNVKIDDKNDKEDKRDREDKQRDKVEREDKREKESDDRKQKPVEKDERKDKPIEREERKEKPMGKEERKDKPSEKSLRLLEQDLQEMKRIAESRNAENSDKPLVPRARGRPPLTPAQKLERMREKMSGRSMARGGSLSGVRPDPGRDRRRDDDRDRLKEQKRPKIEKEDPDNPTRRSSRASKVKDYAKMVNDSESSSLGDEEVESSEGEAEQKPKPAAQTPNTPVKRRGRPPKKQTPATPGPASKPTTITPTTTTTTTPTSASKPSTPVSAPKRRGRPPADKEAKKKRNGEEEEEDMPATPATPATPAPVTPSDINTPLTSTTTISPDKMLTSPSGNVMMTSTGQTLTKVPASLIKSLPPGVKPLPLPLQLQKSMSAASGICEMKMGEKTVKVQKIVMTKAEVEEMKKKGLLEMKHGTMVLKAPKLAGKLPTGDPGALRNFVRAAVAETPAANTGSNEERDLKVNEPPATEMVEPAAETS